MHILLRGGICSLALALTAACAGFYVKEYAPDGVRGLVTLRGPATVSSEGLDLNARVLARAKMSSQVAALAAAGDRRTLRLTVEGDAERLGLLGGVLVAAPPGGDTVVDLPGRVLDRFALQPSVQRVSLLGIVPRS